MKALLNKQLTHWFPGPSERTVLSFSEKLEENIRNGYNMYEQVGRMSGGKDGAAWVKRYWLF